ncbi:MAG: metal-dependent hydrolase [Methanoregula sp.]|nr:metal-dependent hydrolase [Methanoregula sp.]
MDALSHALITYILFTAPGLSPLIPFAILGAVIPDADIIFPAISDKTPSLYLFTHGGIAHSIFGVFVLSLLSYGAAGLLAAAGIIPTGVFTAAGVYGVAAIFAGALLHVAIDVTACPGIPIIAPFSDRKYTLGILPGPSVLLAGVALGVVVVTLLSLLPFSFAIMLYGGTVIIYIAVRLGVFLIADVKLSGRKIPSINPLRWLVVQEDESSYKIRYYTPFRGYSDEVIFEKFRDTDARELAGVLKSPEVRRFLFHSYIVTAERSGSVLTLVDPLREKGYLYYPLKFKRVVVKLD